MKRALIVDDKEENRYYLEALLQGHGFETTSARHGAEALQLAAGERPQVVITDLLMPIMDGYTLLQQWKSDPQLHPIPVVVYTATYTRPEDEQLAFSMGADAFMLKPCEPDRFLEKLGEVLERAARLPAPPLAPLSNEEPALLKEYNQALVRKLEEKSIELERVNQQLLRANDELENRVAQRTEELAIANVNLTRAREVADAANEAKSEFLSRMSHELRTPLNAVLGYGQLLAMQPLRPDDQSSVQYILQAGHHLLALINEVLDIARIEAGHLDLELEWVSVPDTVSQSLGMILPLAKARSLEVKVDLDPIAGISFQADRRRLTQVLVNLLGNAVKYNREGGFISIECAVSAGNHVSIGVRDSGPGIAPEDLSRLFTPFERLAASDSAVEGTGLGLAVSFRLVQAMGGELNVESAPGVGSLFTLTVPLDRDDSSPEGLPAQEAAPAASPVASVLCVEDSPSNYKLIEAVLRGRDGYNLQGVASGAAALAMLEQQKVDVILLDYVLPDMTGQELLARIRADARWRNIPVIVITAENSEELEKQFLASGAQVFLSKPINVNYFRQTLANLCGGPGTQ